MPLGIKLIFVTVALPPFWAGIDLAFGNLFGYAHGYLGLVIFLQRLTFDIVGNELMASIVLISWSTLSLGLILGNLFGGWSKSKS